MTICRATEARGFHPDLAPIARSAAERTQKELALQATVACGPARGYTPAMAKQRFTTAVRSAITGRFVKKSRAKTSPKTTITERIPIKRGRKKK
jgi:hypothetical protein